MKKEIILLSFLFTFVFNLSGQKSILIYTEGKDYLVPTIEKNLETLENIKTNQNLFRDVINFNNVYNNMSDELKITKAINYYSVDDVNRVLNEKAKQSSSAIEKELLDFDYILKIKINNLSDLIEYQFYLYDNLNKLNPDYGNSISVWNVLDPVLSINFFIDPRKEDYENKIKLKVQSLFPESNFPPRAVIKVNDVEANSNDKFVFRHQDLVKIDASEIIDNDTRRRDIEYKWRQIDKNGKVEVPDSMMINFDNGNLQEINFPVVEEYLIGLTLNDGVIASQEDTIRFRICRDPIIWQESTIFNNYSFLNNFTYTWPFQKELHTISTRSRYKFTTNIPINAINNLQLFDLDNQKYVTLHSGGEAKLSPSHTRPIVGGYKTNRLQSNNSELTLNLVSKGIFNGRNLEFRIHDGDSGMRSNSVKFKQEYNSSSRFDIGLELPVFRTHVSIVNDSLNTYFDTNKNIYNLDGRSLFLGVHFILNFQYIIRGNIRQNLSEHESLSLGDEARIYLPFNLARFKRFAFSVGASYNRYKYFNNDTLVHKYSRVSPSFKFGWRLLKWKYFPLSIQFVFNEGSQLTINDNVVINTKVNSINLIYNLGGI